MDYAIAVPARGQVRIEWAMSYAQQSLPMGGRGATIVIKGLGIADARNLAIARAQEMGASCLVMWDDDVLPRSPQAVTMLLAAAEQHPDIAVLGGIYPRRGPYPEPIVIALDGGVIYTWRRNPQDLLPVYCTGTGFTAYNLNLLATLDAENYVIEHDRKRYAVRRYFDIRPDLTDDFYLGELLKREGHLWYAVCAVEADQIDLDGTVYDLDRAFFTRRRNKRP